MATRMASSADAVTVHGTVASGFEPVSEVFAENFRDRDELGAAVAVYHRGQPVVDLWEGTEIPTASTRGRPTRWSSWPLRRRG
ncbi:hypothetical protein ACFQL4_12165 [Halosimplex aquaticum]